MTKKSVAIGPVSRASIALLAVGIAVTAAAQPIRPAPAFKGNALVAAPTANWPTNGGNWYNQRYSPLTKIDRSNVANLKGVWRTRLRGSGIGTKYSGEAQPIVYDGVVYVVTGADDVFALGVDSGEILWSYAANLDASNDVVCCGWTSRGVGLGDGKVFVGQLDGKLVALDQKTGKRRMVGASRALAGRAHDHERAALFRWARHHGLRRRGVRHPRPRQSVRRQAAASSSGRSTRFPGPANSVTTRGRRTTICGCTAAPRSGKRRPSIPSSGSSSSRRATRAPTTTAACAPATTCSRPRSSRSMRRRASTAGTSSRSITTSGTTTARARSCCSISS